MIGEILFVNDASPDEQVLSMITSFKHKDCSVSILTGSVNGGIRSSIYMGVENTKQIGYDTFINLDSDMIVKPDFAKELLRLKAEHAENMVSGINCTMRQKTGEERNPLIWEAKDYYLKKYVAGQCLCFGVEQYEKFIRPALLINGNWDHNASIASDKAGLPIVVAKPSKVQHIGFESSMGHNGYGEAPDQAFDFCETKELNGVTLFGINAADPNGINKAADICQRDIKFGAVKIITERLFPGRTNEEGRYNYSRFMIKNLTEFFDTSHVLVMNNDAFVQNAAAWDDEWLSLDYIGSTWGYKDNQNVGNGGWSLRSKKLCDILAADSTIVELHPEDHHICRTYRTYLEDKYGLKWATEEQANRFGIEAYGASAFPDGNKYSGQFGFHGIHVKGLPIPIK